MIQRPIPGHFTAQQRSFIHHATASERHLYLRATAGSGKTTTLIEVAWQLQQPSVYFAFNKNVVVDLQPRLPQHCRARTLHSHGWQCLKEVNPSLTLDTGKALALAHAVFPKDRARAQQLARAWSIARERVWTAPDAAQAHTLAERVEWDLNPGQLGDLIGVMHAAGDELWAHEGRADYTDYLWLPVRLNVAGGSLGLVMLDEAQDATPLRQTFVRHLLNLGDPVPDQAHRGRLIFVGDPDQLIYAHSDAQPDGLDTLAAQLGAVECPLSVSWRCPAAVVRYAQAYSSFIQAAPQAAAGTVEHWPASAVPYQPGDTVLCRTNAPLLAQALDLMGRGLSVHLSGMDLEQRIDRGLARCLPADGPFANDDVTGLVRAAFAQETAHLQALSSGGDLAARRKLSDLHDLGRCVRHIAWRVSRPTGHATLALARQLLKDVCADRVSADILLTSVHRAKGREWPRVTVLFPELMPASFGDPTEERAVQFVAVTRAQVLLRFAYGEAAWSAGQLVQPASGPAPVRRGAEMPPATEPLRPWQAAQSEAAAILHAQVRAAERQRAMREHPPGTAVAPPGAPVAGVRPPPTTEARPAAARLRTLLDSPRELVRGWAAEQLAALKASGGAQQPDPEQLELYERAWRLARQALAALPAPGVPVCVFERPVARVRYATLVRAGKRVIRLRLADADLRFDAQSGELLSGAGPLTTFIMPAELGRLRQNQSASSAPLRRPGTVYNAP